MSIHRLLLNARHTGTIGAWVAEMAYRTAAPVSEAVAREISAGMLGYNDPLRLTAARESTAGWLRTSYAWDMDSARVGFVGDIVSGYAAVLRHFLPTGAPVVVPTPAYGPLLTVPEFLGHPVVRVPGVETRAGHRMDIDGIERALARGSRLVVLCHPHNPTGRAFSRPELSALTDVVSRHHARVFSDEVHAPLNLSGQPHIPYAAIDERTAAHTITATSASKAWNVAGLKCAQLIFSAAGDVPVWERVAAFYLRSVSRLGVAATCAAYDHPDSHDWLARTLLRLRANSKAVAEAVDAMPGVSCSRTESTYLAWLDCTALGMADPAAHFRSRARVDLADGAEFDSPGHVRLNFALQEPVLAEALAAMAESLKGFTGSGAGILNVQADLADPTGETV
ncbi:MalY/PatB family protein [Streptomyces atratus]|uniref:MalY/PatB family protein n=1 Tax=Streptomyces atratus TaxID=1893 RepID=UPI001671840D|nr:aminotransferase class I/II-fold pyridoxal phosphate-dependent enzyme [Streptomyces atratus]